MKKIFMLLSLICITCMAWGKDVNELMRKAQTGDAEAQCRLGQAYDCGWYGLKKMKVKRPNGISRLQNKDMLRPKIKSDFFI